MAKRKPPQPKSTANLSPGLKKYWESKGVPSGGSSKSSSKKSSSKKSTSKRTTKRTTSKKK